MLAAILANPAGEHQHTVNVQPVIPISISEDWNLISRTILPIISQEDLIPGTDQSGFGDIVQSVFFSPKAPTASGLTWGVGPAIVLPTGSNEFSADTWAAGPTAVVLKQQGRFTIGALANHLEDVSGDAEISATFLQPFLSYSLGKGRTFGLNTESTYDWEGKQWTIPVNVTYSKVTKIGSLSLAPVSVSVKKKMIAVIARLVRRSPSSPPIASTVLW